MSSTTAPAQAPTRSAFAPLRRAARTFVRDDVVVHDVTFSRREILGLAAVFGLLTVELLAASLYRAWATMSSYDLAYFRQASWLIAHGHQPFVTIRGLYLLADHASYVMFPIGWLSRVVPSQGLLLGVQAVALAAGVVPLYLLARRVGGLSQPLAFALCAAYALFPATHNINMYDFHPEVLAIPAFLGATYSGLVRRWVLFAACIALALSCREDMAVPAMALGFVLALKGRGRAGLLTIGVAAAVMVLDTSVVMPHFANGQFQQGNRLGNWAPTMPKALYAMARQPLEVANDLFRDDNLSTLIALFAPLLFLSLLSPMWLLPGIPLQFLYMMSTVENAHTIESQYTVGIIPFLFVAAVMTLGRRSWPTKQLVALLTIASIGFSWSLSAEATEYIRDGGDLFAHDATSRAVDDAAALVGPADSVMATVRIWQPLAERKDLYAFPMLFDGSYLPPEDPELLATRQADVDWVIVDTADAGQWNVAWWGALDKIVSQQHFEKVFDRAGVVAYHR